MKNHKKRFYISYIDDNDDLSHVWVMADNYNQAKEMVEREYWDIKEIISIQPEK